MAKEPKTTEQQADAPTPTQTQTPTPQVNPTVPVGPVKIGTVGIDTSHNVWGFPIGAAPFFIATIAGPPYPAL